MQSVSNIEIASHERPLAGLRALRGRLWLAFALLPLWLGSFAAFRPLAEPDEGRYTHIARWMTVSGDWLVPRINGLPFLHKPPLYYWLDALIIDAFGLHFATARLVSIMAALVTCACVYRLVVVRNGTQEAAWSVAVLVTSPLFFGAAQFANLDMLVSAFITLTLTFAISAADTTAGRDRSLWLAAYFTAALGVLTKGLIGAVLPAGIFITWALVERRPELIRRAVSLQGLALSFAVAAPWFLVLESKFPGFNHFFFVYHHIERFLTDEFNGHYGPWFYPVVVFGGVLPWSLAFLIRLLSRQASYEHVLDKLALTPLRRLAAIWLAFVVVFFSVPSSKMIGYVIPAMPAFAMLAGPVVSRWKHRRAALLLAIAICIAFGTVGPHWQKRTPVDLAEVAAKSIARGDNVIVMDHFYYDVVVDLDRDKPVYIGDFVWNEPSADVPDSLRRQLIEGKEFAADAGRVLIDNTQFEAMTRHPTARNWIMLGSNFDARFPWLAGTPVLARSGEHVLIRIEPK